MIYGSYNQPFQIHIDKISAIPEEKWVYGAFNFIIDEKFYPGKGTNWTLNIIIDWLKSFLSEDLNDYCMLDCENENAEYLFKQATISRLGYYYDDPDKILSQEELKTKYPKKVGIEISLYEITYSGLEMFFFRGKENDILVVSFLDEIFKIDLEIGYFHSVISSISEE